MYGIDRGGLSNVIPRSLQTSKHRGCYRQRCLTTSKPSERHRTAANKDLDPGRILISITQWQQKRYEGSREYVRGQDDTGDSDGGRLAVLRQSVLHFFEVAPVSGERKRFLDGSRT
jgi:hypothetical protein